MAFSVAVSKVENEFLPSKHFKEWCDRIQNFNRTATISARYALKTTIALGYIAWKLFRLEKDYNELEYMGYKDELAGYHLKKLKRYISALPQLFGDYQNLTEAEAVLRYAKNGREFICEPSGILSFNRGRHPDELLCDDILRDPEIRLDITQLKKIETSFFEEVEQMPKNKLHLFGTPQDRNDLFSTLEQRAVYNVKRYPAILNYETKEVLWPEKFPFEKLMEIKSTIGEKAFNKEFLCRPVRSEEGFFREETLDKIIKKRLKNYGLHKSLKLNEWTCAGFDIGKKTHPSHLAIFGIDRKKRLVQIHSHWFDNIDYINQIEYLRQAIKIFNISTLYFDHTRSEFEGFREQGELPSQMRGIIFTAKSKFEMASELDRLVAQEKILLLPDERQKRQLLNVDNNLQAVETNEGHGDCFYSICLAALAYKKGSRRMIYEIEID
jgi:hypothetical protein